MSPLLIIGCAFAAGVGIGVVGLVQPLVSMFIVRRKLHAWKRAAGDVDAGALDRPPP